MEEISYNLRMTHPNLNKNQNLSLSWLILRNGEDKTYTPILAISEDMRQSHLPQEVKESFAELDGGEELELLQAFLDWAKPLELSR